MFITSTVIGFHGCDRDIGEKILAGEEMSPSRNEYDWLGDGIYFWENDPLRANDWASFVHNRPELFKTKINKPFVIGAIIDLGNCLDLADFESLVDLTLAYDQLEISSQKSNVSLPKNLKGFSGDEDLVKRHLDCAVINYLHGLRDRRGLQPYTSVRGPFIEGQPLFPGSKIMAKTHVQIAVRTPSTIKGYFRVKSQ